MKKVVMALNVFDFVLKKYGKCS